MDDLLDFVLDAHGGLERCPGRRRRRDRRDAEDLQASLFQTEV
jgi:hypothetical protein